MREGSLSESSRTGGWAPGQNRRITAWGRKREVFHWLSSDVVFSEVNQLSAACEKDQTQARTRVLAPN